MITNLDILRYRYLAFLTIRDSIGFYLGIPKFIESVDIPEIIEEKLQEKLSTKLNPTDRQISKYRNSIAKSIEARLAYLLDDYKSCEDVLFNDNIWLQLLDLDPTFMKSYINKLSSDMKEELAVVPSWTIRDDSLRRPYLNNDRPIKEIKF